MVKINFLLWIFNCQVSYINDHTLLYVLKQLRNTLFDKNFVKLFGFCFSGLWPVAQEWRLVYNNTKVMTSWLQNWTLCLYYLFKSLILRKTHVSQKTRLPYPIFRGLHLALHWQHWHCINGKSMAAVGFFFGKRLSTAPFCAKLKLNSLETLAWVLLLVL